MSEQTETVEDLRDVLRRNGFVKCDISACNCGSWHARYGLRQRMDEVAELVSEAGHPLTNENGHLVRLALSALIAERDSLRALNAELLEALEKARSGLSNGLWDYGPGQDEHAQCNELIEEVDAAIAKASALKGDSHEQG